MTEETFTPTARQLAAFAGFEISPVREIITVGLLDTSLTVSDVACADLWTLYGVRQSGMVEALHDAPDEAGTINALSAALAVVPLPISYADEDRHLDPVPTLAAFVDALTGTILDAIPLHDSPIEDRRDDDFDAHPLACLRDAFVDQMSD